MKDEKYKEISSEKTSVLLRQMSIINEVTNKPIAKKSNHHKDAHGYQIMHILGG